jgi:hypothetical protein
MGDMILVLDNDLNVLWTWDAFDHLDPHKAAILGETCSAISAGCAPYYLAPQVNDWLHGNAVQLTPDGNLLYSVRHLDWLIKIAYDNGNGDGSIIWKLGKDGDFAIDFGDPNSWFSHQHDPRLLTSDTLILFDNGNTRHAQDPTANSRGQMWRIDEKNRVVSLVLNADMGAFSPALGSAQKLSNGNYHFNVGWLPDFASQSVEISPSGDSIYSLKIGTLEYRTFRMKDLYTP